MAWSWSHTAKGIAAVEENLRDLDFDTLVEIMAEWVVHNENDDIPSWMLDPDLYAKAERDIRKEYAGGGGTDMLADEIWAKTVDLATCDNGGFNAWICPHGCHTASFTRNTEGT